MEQLLSIAATQHGLVTRQQAHTCGLTNAMLRQRVRVGVLEPVDANVFRVRGAPATWLQKVQLACLAGPAICLASHRTAAKLHGFDMFAATPARIEVVVAHTQRY